jgi:hypothetical protein
VAGGVRALMSLLPDQSYGLPFTPCAFQQPQFPAPCRVGVKIREQEETSTHTLHGWGVVDDGCLVFFDRESEGDHWMAFPLHAVNWIEWQARDAEGSTDA